MNLYLFDNTNVSSIQFLDGIGVGTGNPSYTSLAQSIAISHLTARAIVRRPSGEIEDWWYIGNEYPVYKELMYTNVI